jgi:6-phosphogluconate dehydrogenase
MKIGMVGLGRMGSGMTRRLEAHGQEVATYDPNVESTARTLAALKKQLEPPRHVWVMVPSGKVTDDTVQKLIRLLDPGDTIIDGGNSNFRDSQRRYKEARKEKIAFVDVGTSGGIWGFEVGFCLMAGGDKAPVKRLKPVLDALAPENGWAHVGGPGAGHFTKMVHNGIEYGLMQAYAEGFEIMHASDYGLDLAAISELWMQGSVVRSWLLELLGRAFKANGRDLEHLKGWVADSGEGRWTVQEAIDKDVPAPVITLSLLTRFRSRQDDSYTGKVLAALRNEFGGHAVKTE